MHPIRSIRLIARDEGGFSLLEMAIVLAIIGLIGGLTFPLLKRHFDHRHLAVTQARMTEIEDALAAFLVTFHRLPCPATDQSGFAKVACPDGQARGMVPYGTLGLNRETAQDGRGRFFTYAVHPDLTTLKSDLKYGFCSVTRPALHLAAQDKSRGLGDENVIAFLLLAGVNQAKGGSGEIPSALQDQSDLVFHGQSAHREERRQTGQEIMRFQTIRNFAGICLKVNLAHMGNGDRGVPSPPQGAPYPSNHGQHPSATEGPSQLFDDDPIE